MILHFLTRENVTLPHLTRLHVVQQLLLPKYLTHYISREKCYNAKIALCFVSAKLDRYILLDPKNAAAERKFITSFVCEGILTNIFYSELLD